MDGGAAVNPEFLVQAGNKILCTFFGATVGPRLQLLMQGVGQILDMDVPFTEYVDGLGKNRHWWVSVVPLITLDSPPVLVYPGEPYAAYVQVMLDMKRRTGKCVGWAWGFELQSGLEKLHEMWQLSYRMLAWRHGDGSMGIKATLTEEQIQRCREVGKLRQDDADRRGYQDQEGFEGDGLEIHIAGCYAEQAVSIVTGIPWQASVGTFRKGGDVGPHEVRGTPEHAHSLIIRKRDEENLDRRFYLVTGPLHDLWVRGWIIGRDGCQDQWKRSPVGRPAAWFVPAGVLNPVES